MQHANRRDVERVDAGCLEGGGEAGALLRSIDWDRNPLGPPDNWPAGLCTLTALMLAAQQPMLIVWGPSHITLYNDGYAAMCGDRHPAALGRPFEELWHDIWEDVEPILTRAYAGHATHMTDIAFTMHRNGFPEETHFAFGYTPVRDDRGQVAGMFCACMETTVSVRENAETAGDRARLERLFAASPSFVAVLAGPDNRIAFVNPCFARLLPDAPVDERRLDELLPILTSGGGAEMLAEVRATGKSRKTRAILIPVAADDRSGSGVRSIEFHFQLLANPAEAAGSVLVEGVDVTDRVRAATALRESEARFRNMADDAPVMLWVTGPDGRCLYLNRGWYDFTGQAPAKAVGFGWLDAVHPDDREWSGETFRRANAEHAPFRIEYRLRHADGEYRWAIDAASPRFDEHGGFLGYVGSVVDIHDRKIAEEGFAATARTLDAVLDNATGAVFMLDVDQRCVYLNRAAEELSGYTIDEIRGRAMHAVLHHSHPDGSPYPQTDCPITGASSGETQRGEEVFVHKDGRFYPVAFTASPIRDLDGTPVGTVVEARDITAERQAAAQIDAFHASLEQQVVERTAALMDTEAALRQAQKMEAVGQLTGGLAHDFNNLLTAISGSLELMRARLEHGRVDGLDRYLDMAGDATGRAASLTHRLLAFSRRQTLDPKPTDVNQLLAGLEALVSRTIGPEIALSIEGDPVLPPTLVDASQLENAILNLCINARDAMPDGGRISIATRSMMLDENAAAESDVPPGRYLEIRVIDTGSGMPADIAAKAFDPFFTTKPMGSGTGLGLSMVYGFVRQSGGQVRLRSSPGRGTMVELRLPAWIGAPEPGPGGRGHGHAATARPGDTVLVVDDEPAIRMLVVEHLAELGYATLAAADGAAALAAMGADARIDLLVTDIGLPGGINGRQLADAARARRPDLGVLFITGYAETAVMGNGRLDSGTSVLTKPFDFDTLGERVHDLLEATAHRRS